MLIPILKAFLLGVLVAVPVGPVLFFVIQKTLCDSRRAGMYSGLGSAFADSVYVAIGVFALGLVRGFIDDHTPVIMLVGGVLVFFLGLKMFRSTVQDPLAADSAPRQGKPWIWYSSQTALSAFSNPAALVVAMGLLALFHLDSASLLIPAWIVVPCVFVGELSYWTLVTFILSRLHPAHKVLVLINRIAGAAIMALSVYLVVKGSITLLQ